MLLLCLFSYVYGQACHSFLDFRQRQKGNVFPGTASSSDFLSQICIGAFQIVFLHLCTNIRYNIGMDFCFHDRDLPKWWEWVEQAGQRQWPLSRSTNQSREKINEVTVYKCTWQDGSLNFCFDWNIKIRQVWQKIIKMQWLHTKQTKMKLA